MNEFKTLEELFAHLLKKYEEASDCIIWEMSGRISEDEEKLKAEIGFYKSEFERMNKTSLQLQIAPGTVVYQIYNNTDACYDCPCYSDFYGMDAMCDKVKTDNVSGPRYSDHPLCEKQFLEIIEFKADLDFIFCHRNDIGKTVFLTREEAEAALAEKGGAE